MTTTDAAAAETGPQADGAAEFAAMEAELAAGIQANLAKGFDAAVALVAGAMGASTLFALPATGLVDGADRMAAVWLGNDGGQTIVLALLEEGGTVVRVAQAGGGMANIGRFVCSFVEVLGQLRDLEAAPAEAA